VIGVLLLGQVPGGWPVLGICFVVAAGVGAERTGSRHQGEAHETVLGEQPATAR
jgi:inner membrane transporter RhtA